MKTQVACRSSLLVFPDFCIPTAEQASQWPDWGCFRLYAEPVFWYAYLRVPELAGLEFLSGLHVPPVAQYRHGVGWKCVEHRRAMRHLVTSSSGCLARLH